MPEEPVDYEKYRLLFEIFLFLWNAVLVGYVLKIYSLERRLFLVEGVTQNAPNHNDLGKIYERLGTVDRGLGELRGEFKTIRSVLELIHESLLQERNQ